MYEWSVPEGTSTGGIAVISSGVFKDVPANHRNGTRLSMTIVNVVK